VVRSLGYQPPSGPPLGGWILHCAPTTLLLLLGCSVHEPEPHVRCLSFSSSRCLLQARFRKLLEHPHSRKIERQTGVSRPGSRADLGIPLSRNAATPAFTGISTAATLRAFN
jgi:hypothetical protein